MKYFLIIVAMFALMFLLLFSKTAASAGATADAKGEEPRFHYGDCVKVIRGFYGGCHGRVTEDRGGGDFEVNLSCQNGGGTVQTIFEAALSPQKQSVCKDQ